MLLNELIRIREVISLFEKKLKKFKELKQVSLIRIYESRISYFKKREQQLVDQLSSSDLDTL